MSKEDEYWARHTKPEDMWIFRRPEPKKLPDADELERLLREADDELERRIRENGELERHQDQKIIDEYNQTKENFDLDL